MQQAVAGKQMKCIPLHHSLRETFWVCAPLPPGKASAKSIAFKNTTPAPCLCILFPVAPEP